MRESAKTLFGLFLLLALSIAVLLMRPFAVLLRERPPPEDDSY